MSTSAGHIDDAASGLRYLHPSGWVQDSADLVEPLTSRMTCGEDSIVASGRWSPMFGDMDSSPPSPDELMAGAAWLASEYGDFYVREPGDRSEVRMTTTTAAGKPAAVAGFRQGSAYVRVLVVAVHPDLVSFLLAVAPATARPLIDEILASTQPLN